MEILNYYQISEIYVTNYNCFAQHTDPIILSGNKSPTLDVMGCVQSSCLVLISSGTPKSKACIYT